MRSWNFHRCPVCLSFPGAVCKHLGYEGGDPLCCSPYGPVEWRRHALRNVSCQREATALHQCSYRYMNRTHLQQEMPAGMLPPEFFDTNETFCEAHDYAAVVCRNGSAPDQQGTHPWRRRAGSFEACCQWALLRLHTSSTTLPFAYILYRRTFTLRDRESQMCCCCV